MKRLLLASLIMAVVVRGAAGADEKFSSVVSPADLSAAGLAGLTPAQLEKLNALVENYKSGALIAARRAAEEAVAAKQAAEVQAARAEAKAEAARADAAKAEVARAAAVAKPAAGSSILAKARGLLKPEPKEEVTAIESSIPGKFRGWGPHQIITLANGQSWQVSNNDSYYTPVIENPKVQIMPAALAGFWLRIPELDAQVRVNLVGEK